MTHVKRRFLVLALVLSSASAAQAASEALSASAALSFQAAAFGPGLPSLRMRALSGFADKDVLGGAVLLGEEAVPVALSTLAADLDLRTLLNAQLKTSLRFDMGGKTVWCGGAFDRQQNAYVSVLIEGEAARYFDIMRLSSRLELFKIGTKTYRIWLSPNIFNKLKSEIIFTDMGSGKNTTRFDLAAMLSAVAAAGAPVTLSGQPYRVFYTDGLNGNQADASSRLLSFVTGDPAGEFHVYLIPEGSVPADRIAVFKMFGDRPVGLMRQADSLKVYENP